MTLVMSIGWATSVIRNLEKNILTSWVVVFGFIGQLFKPWISVYCFVFRVSLNKFVLKCYKMCRESTSQSQLFLALQAFIVYALICHYWLILEHWTRSCAFLEACSFYSKLAWCYQEHTLLYGKAGGGLTCVLRSFL